MKSLRQLWRNIMNAANNNVAHAIIARFLESENLPAAFFADEQPTEKVKAYIEGKGIVELTLEQYKNTAPLHPEDAKLVANKYQAAFGLTEVKLRDRMPYKKEASKLPQRLASVEGGQLSVNKELALTAPKEQQAVIAAIANKPKRKYTKRAESAKARANEDALKAAVVSLKSIEGTATPEQKQAAVRDLADKLAVILASAM